MTRLIGPASGSCPVNAQPHSPSQAAPSAPAGSVHVGGLLVRGIETT
ncbi:MAG: hypothetical protein HOV94_39355 [Saccharothrix sp.]|nr:hypothetical protein [Saccharothrix sp.]